MVIHFVLGTKQFSAQTSELVSTLGVHDGRVGAQSGRVPIHAAADGTRPRFVEGQLARGFTTCHNYKQNIMTIVIQFNK